VVVFTSGASPVTSTVWLTDPDLQSNVHDRFQRDREHQSGAGCHLEPFVLHADVVVSNLKSRNAIAAIRFRLSLHAFVEFPCFARSHWLRRQPRR